MKWIGLRNIGSWIMNGDIKKQVGEVSYTMPKVEVKPATKPFKGVIETKSGVTRPVRSRSLNCAAPQSGKCWSSDDDKSVLDLRSKKVPYDVIGKLLNRSEKACNIRYSILTRGRNKGKHFTHWSTEDIVRYMELSSEGVGLHVIAKKLGRSYDAVRVMGGRLRKDSDFRNRSEVKLAYSRFGGV